MARIQTYDIDTVISDSDIVLGSDNNDNKKTKNYLVGSLKQYILDGLSPEIGGNLKITDVIGDSGENLPTVILNTLDPVYNASAYEILVITCDNKDVYICKLNNRAFGFSETPTVITDYIKIFSKTLVVQGTNVTITGDGLNTPYTINASGGGGELTLQDVINNGNTLTTSSTIKGYMSTSDGMFELYIDDGGNYNTNAHIDLYQSEGFNPSFELKGTSENSFGNFIVKGKFGVELDLSDGGTLYLASEGKQGAEPLSRSSQLYLNKDQAYLQSVNPNTDVSSALECKSEWTRLSRSNANSSINNIFQIQKPTSGGVNQIIELPALNTANATKYIPLRFTNGTATVEANSTGLVNISSILVVESNPQKTITSSYTLVNADKDYTIFINNGATPITITINTSITTANFGVGFVQEGTGDVTFVGTGVTLSNPIGLKSKGQGYATFIERKLNTSTYYLLGDTKA